MQCGPIRHQIATGEGPRGRDRPRTLDVRETAFAVARRRRDADPRAVPSARRERGAQRARLRRRRSTRSPRADAASCSASGRSTAPCLPRGSAPEASRRSSSRAASASAHAQPSSTEIERTPRSTAARRRGHRPVPRRGLRLPPARHPLPRLPRLLQGPPRPVHRPAHARPRGQDQRPRLRLRRRPRPRPPRDAHSPPRHLQDTGIQREHDQAARLAATHRSYTGCMTVTIDLPERRARAAAGRGEAARRQHRRRDRGAGRSASRRDRSQRRGSSRSSGWARRLPDVTPAMPTTSSQTASAATDACSSSTRACCSRPPTTPTPTTEPCTATIQNAGPLVTTALVIAETAYLIGRQLGAAAEAALLPRRGGRRDPGRADHARETRDGSPT